MTIEYLKNKTITTINREEEQHLVIDETKETSKIKLKPMPWVAKTIQKRMGMKIWKGTERPKVPVADTLPLDAIIIDTLQKFKDLNYEGTNSV